MRGHRRGLVVYERVAGPRDPLARRSTIPEIYAAFRNRKMPQQPWLSSLMTWGGLILALVSIISYVVRYFQQR